MRVGPKTVPEMCVEFFMVKVLPDTVTHLVKIQAGADARMVLNTEAF